MLMLYLSLIETQEKKDKFTVLYHEHRQDMFKKANDILNDPSLAEDAVQDAFLSIAKNFSIIKCKEKCNKTRNYFVTIVKSKSIDIYRKRRIIYDKERVSYDTIEDILFDDLSDATEIVDKKEEYSNLHICIAKLPPHYQAILEMKFFHNHTNKELASIFGISENNVRVREMRARQKLEEMLNKEEVYNG